MTKTVGIVGGAGYTAGELIRLLVRHPQVELKFVYSTSNAGNAISGVHQDLYGDIDMRFSDKISNDVDILFLCLGHGNSKSFLERNNFPENTHIIDLSNDFRLKNNRSFKDKNFVYGLPELNKKSIMEARNIANPGCFATVIQLALLPLANAKKLRDDIHINATTGATGAGVSLSSTTHFTWRDNNFSSYKVFEHQHLGEIGDSLRQLQPDFKKEVLFIPNRGNFSRGIFATVYTSFDDSLKKAVDLYYNYYKDTAFTKLSHDPVHLKQVVNTNKCLLHLHLNKGYLIITGVMDNLIKGASGQALQNMNLIFNFKEKEGLDLKASSF